MDTNISTNDDTFRIISDYTVDLANNNFNTLGTSSMVARSDVPQSHIKIADNFMLIKKLFGFSAVHSKISFEERKFLADFNFNTLEFSTIAQINDEIMVLKRWNESGDKKLRDASEQIMQIRAKELKHLISTSYREITNEMYNGYKNLERYFAVITKY